MRALQFCISGETMTPTKPKQANLTSAEQVDEDSMHSGTNKAVKRKLPSPAEDTDHVTGRKKRRHSADDVASLLNKEPPLPRADSANLKKFETVPRRAKKRAPSPPSLSESWQRAVTKKQRLSSDADASHDNRKPSQREAPPPHEEQRFGSPAQQRSCSPPANSDDSTVHSEKFVPWTFTDYDYDAFTPLIATDWDEALTYDGEFVSPIVSDTGGSLCIYKEDMDKVRRELNELGVRLFEKQEVAAMTDAAREELGRGAYGSCTKTVDPHTQQQLVIKTFFLNDFDNLLAEAKTLHHLQMAGVQRLVGVCVDTCQLLTLFAGNTATQYFQKPVPFTDAATIFLQLARAAKGIVDKGFTHNDFKGDNACVSNESSGPVATVIDLGLARPAGCDHLFHTKLHPEHYPWLPPELLTHTHPTSEASDVYVFATMMEDLLTLEEGSARPPLPAALATWMQAARRPDPAHRPTLAALVQVLEALLGGASRASPSPPGD